MANKKILSAIVFLSLFCVAGFVFAQGPVTIPDPLGIGNNPKGAEILLTRIAKGVGMVIASLATIMIIWAGILYLTSAGSPEKITKAKTAFIYAIIGIAIGISASVIADVIVGILKEGP